ncbi:MAG: carbohydrate binding domain/collagen triple helix repeat protein [Caudoviricetes sp.]|nr:MAG: carbohydrate binding domain/collagen triple helix repeat protein [Caudoviricetes sp.]
MAEFTANAIQTVAANQNVLFTDEPICGNCSIMHRDGSGLVTLRANNCKQCRARFKIFFSGNIAIATGGTAGPISLAIATGGEGIGPTTMTVTPAAVGDYFNVASETYLDVPCGCCAQVSVKNVSTQAVDVQNANLIVERVA